jgi:hypothetical protein
MATPLLFKRIRRLSAPSNGCLEWGGYMQGGVTPMMMWEGSAATVRKLILDHRGVDMKGKVAWVSCGCNSCVKPAHVIAITRGERNALMLAAQSPAKRAARARKHATTQHAKSVVNWDVVRSIRASNESVRVLAAKHGITGSWAHKIKTGSAWKETNPFEGLA